MNPVRFYDPDRATTDTYQTPHFDDFPMTERLLPWQVPADYHQPWQTTDIIYLQFESTFDPIIVELIDENGSSVITLPALVGLPNRYYPNTFSYEVEMSLASLDPGCYRIKITAGSAGPTQKVYWSHYLDISEDPLANTVLVKYKNSRFHEDVVFETGIEFQVRLPGHFGLLDPGRSEERYKDQRYTPSLLSSRSFRKFPLILGDEFGLPDEIIDLVNRICGCDSITIDGKSFCVAEGSSFDLLDAEGYPKRGIKLLMEEGINRGSKIFAQDIDPNKKLSYGIVVEAKVWGDTSNSGSSNTVPVTTVL